MTRCFGRSPAPPTGDPPPPLPCALGSVAAQALADLLPLLSCGEEAASIAFGRLAVDGSFDTVVERRLTAIGAEEDVHHALLTALAGVLPPPAQSDAARRASRRFHIRLAAGGPILHLARIAAVDAAVCTILSRLIARSTPVGDDPALHALFARIRRDEARHVAVARMTIRGRAPRSMLSEAASLARVDLAALLDTGGEAFESLRVDPGMLRRDVAHLPHGLV